MQSIVDVVMGVGWSAWLGDAFVIISSAQLSAHILRPARGRLREAILRADQRRS
jgi:hypothetical protein